MTSPSSGDVWYTGQTYTIRWTSSGVDRVYIELYSGSSRIRTIASNISNSGQYTWTVDSDLSSGSNYRIKVIDASDASVYDYSDYFEIRESASSCDTLLVVNDYVKLFADCIRYNSSGNYYTLEGNPNINKLLYFTNDILYGDLIIWGNADLEIPTPLGNVTIDLPDMGFEFDVSGDTLSFENYAGELTIAGCDLSISRFRVSNNFVEVSGILRLPFVELNLNDLIIDKNRGISFSVDINSNISYRGFALKNLNLTYSQSDDIISGGLSLEIPSLFTFSGGLGIVNGALDSIFVVIEPGSPIPIDATGLFLSEGGGGVSNLSRGPWKVIICAGVTGGPKLGNQYIIELDGCFETTPPEYFAARNISLSLLDMELAYADAIYDRGALSLDFGFNLIVVGGNVHSLLQGNIFNGNFNGYIGLEDSVEFMFGPIAILIPDIQLAGVDGTFNNNQIQGAFTVNLRDLLGSSFPDMNLSLAYRVEFYPNDINIYLGTNFDNLVQVGKTADSIVSFEVDPYTNKLLIFIKGSNGIPYSRILSPSGTVYDSSYQFYFERENYGMYIINSPDIGRWDVTFNGSNSYEIYALAERAPVVIEFLDTASIIKDANDPIEIWSPKDSVCVNIYLTYDKNGIGTFIGTSCLNYGINIINLPPYRDGEYYLRIETVNDPFSLSVYSPFKVSYSYGNALPCPSSIFATVIDSGILLVWDTSGVGYSNILGYSIYYKDIRGSSWKSFGISKDSIRYILRDLVPGKRYIFRVGAYDFVGNKSSWSCLPTDTIMYKDNNYNNPPYIVDYPRSIRVFKNSTYNYDVEVEDFDNDFVTLDLFNAPEGMYISERRLIWNVPDSVFAGRFYMIAKDIHNATDTVEISFVTVDSTIMKMTLSIDRSAYFTYEDRAIVMLSVPHDTFLNEPAIHVYSTSDNTGISLKLKRKNRNVFTGIFGFTNSASENNKLRVSDGDTIFVVYGDKSRTALFYETPVFFEEREYENRENYIFGFWIINYDRYNGKLLARLTMPSKGKFKVEIYNVSGRLVSVPIDKIFNKGSHSFSIDLNNLPTGIYLLKAYDESGNKVVKKIIIIN